MREARENVEIHYGGRKVNRLSLVKLRLHNRGLDTLRDAHFTVKFNPEVNIVGTPTPAVRPEQNQDLVLPITEDEQYQHQKKFYVSYLNAFRPYKQEVIIDFICDGQISDVTVLGSGPGWSIKSWSLTDKDRVQERTKNIEKILVACGVILIFIGALASSEPWVIVGFGFLGIFGIFNTVGRPFVKWFFKWRYGISIRL